MYKISNRAPCADDFNRLRVKVGWGEVALELAQTSLDNSLFHVNYSHANELIAMGRVIGDGGLNFYIQDVVVAPDFQEQGLGHSIMEKIEAYLEGATSKGATIALLSAYKKEGFYQRYGYIVRPNSHMGKGMCRSV